MIDSDISKIDHVRDLVLQQFAGKTGYNVAHFIAGTADAIAFLLATFPLELRESAFVAFISGVTKEHERACEWIDHHLPEKQGATLTDESPKG